MIPESIVWALEDCRSSFVDIFCGQASKEEVAKEFDRILREKWKAAYDGVVKEYSREGLEADLESGYFPESFEDSLPHNIEIKEDRILVRFEPLYISYCFVEYCEIDNACEAVDQSFVSLKEKFPDITYDGMINFPWSDTHGGDEVVYRLSSEKEPNEEGVFKSYGEILEEAIEESIKDEEDEYNFINQVVGELENIEESRSYAEVIKFLNQHKEYLKEENFDKLIGILGSSAKRTLGVDISGVV